MGHSRFNRVSDADSQTPGAQQQQYDEAMEKIVKVLLYVDGNSSESNTKNCRC